MKVKWDDFIRMLSRLILGGANVGVEIMGSLLILSWKFPGADGDLMALELEEEEEEEEQACQHSGSSC